MTQAPGYALNFLRTISEYGSEMNSSIVALERKEELGFFSFYITSCFQHIYFATSTLWGEEGRSLFGQGIVEFASSVGVIR